MCNLSHFTKKLNYLNSASIYIKHSNTFIFMITLYKQATDNTNYSHACVYKTASLSVVLHM